jgi:serpin B
MRHPLALAAALVLVPALLAACGTSNPPAPPPNPDLRSDKIRVTNPAVSDTDAAELAAGNMAFAVDMHHRLRAANTGNFIFSQTSISTALAMLYAGAATTTASEMANTLHFSLPPDRLHAAFNALDLALTTPPAGGDAAAFRLKLANSTWVQEGFSVLPAYLDTLAVNYGAGLFAKDFVTAPEAARVDINQWVSEQTEDHIPELFPEGVINGMTRLVLANAVFFHGDWKKPFAHNSQNAPFHAPGGDVSVPMMLGSGNARLWSGAGYGAASAAYVGDTTSMIVVVPDAGTFDAFEASLSAQSLAAILSPAQTGGGDLHMPRFKFETAANLSDALAQMGMPEAFSMAADFSGINGARNLHVQGVVHKATITVDEKGTTAAAATGVVVGTTSLPPTLRADRPFLFFIRHEPTGAILFQGRVLDPSST